MKVSVCNATGVHLKHSDTTIKNEKKKKKNYRVTAYRIEREGVQKDALCKEFKPNNMSTPVK